MPTVTTKNFLTNMENQAGVSTQNAVVPPTVKPSDFVQKLVGFAAEDSNKADPRCVCMCVIISPFSFSFAFRITRFSKNIS